MLKADMAVWICFVLAMFFWVRGVWKKNRGDIILSAAVFIAAIYVYMQLYPFTSMTGVPWICLAVAAAAAAGVIAGRRYWKTARAWAVTVVIAPLVLSAALFAAEQSWGLSSNALMVIQPYRHAGTWVFDDARVGLKAEPFVAGIPTLMDKLVEDAGIENADDGFRLLFSLRSFPGYQTKVVRKRPESGGWWYYSEKYEEEGWLCPALFKYFRRAPKEIYVRAEALKE